MTKTASICVVLGAVLYLVGPAFPGMDRKEAAAAYSVRVALAGGSWLIPPQPEGPDLSKPPMLFWFRGAVAALAGGAGKAGVRLPSLFAAAAILLLTFMFARVSFGPAVARLAAAILLLTPDFFFYSTTGVAGHDVLLCLCFLTIVCFADEFRKTSKVRHLYLIGIAAGIGCLVKAHVIVLFIAAAAPALAFLALKARVRVERRVLAHAVAAGVLAAAVGTWWYWLAASRVPGALEGFLSTARAVTTRESDFHLPYYLIEAGFPWSILWPFAISSLVRRRWDDPDPRAIPHLLAWTIPVAVVVLFVLRGAEYYLVTLYPLFSVVLAREIHHRTVANAPIGVAVRVSGVAGLLVDSTKALRFLFVAATAALFIIFAGRVDRAAKPGYDDFAKEVNMLLEQYPDRLCLAATAPQALPTYWMPCFDRNATIEQIKLIRGSGRTVFVITYVEQKKSIEAIGCRLVMSGGPEDEGHRLHLFRCSP